MTGAPPTCTQSIQDKWAYGSWIQRVWFDGGGGGWEAYFQFLTSDSFKGNALLDDGILPKRGGKWLGPLDTCHKGR